MTQTPLVIDDSHWNIEHLPLFQQAGIVGLVHKATQGQLFKDPTYLDRTKMAREAGFLTGAYHFGDGTYAISQADKFLDFVQPDEKTLIALDLERNPNGSSMLLWGASQFCQRIYDKLKRWPVLYTGKWYTEEILPRHYDGTLLKCPLWVASYTSTTPILPDQWSNWTLWQYTDGIVGEEPHKIAGIDANLDLDTYNGTVDELKAWWGT